MCQYRSLDEELRRNPGSSGKLRQVCAELNLEKPKGYAIPLQFTDRLNQPMEGLGGAIGSGALVGHATELCQSLHNPCVFFLSKLGKNWQAQNFRGRLFRHR